VSGIPRSELHQTHRVRRFAAAARQIASKLRSYAFGRSGIAACTNLGEAWSGPHSDEAEHAVSGIPRSQLHQTHRVCRFAAAARQIASKLRSYAFGRSGNAARTNLGEAWSGPHSDEAEPAVCRAYRGVSFIRHTACAGLLPLRARSRASCAPTPSAEAAMRRAQTCWLGLGRIRTKLNMRCVGHTEQSASSDTPRAQVLLPLRARSRASCAPTPSAEAAVRRAQICWSEACPRS